MKDVYFEINKIYSEDDINLHKWLEINLFKLCRTNIVGYKNPSKSFDYAYIETYFNAYIKQIKNKQIKYKNNKKKNLEALEYIIQIPGQLAEKENKNKRNKFIDEIKEELLEDTTFISYIRKTKGKSTYLHILCLDRYFWKDSKVLKKVIKYQKDIFRNAKGRMCKIDDPTARKIHSKGQIETRDEIRYISDKRRIEYINTNPSEEKENKVFKTFIKYIKNKINQLLEKHLNKALNNVFKIFKKKSIKQKKRVKNRYVYVNKKEYLHNYLEQYEFRKIKGYNSLINILNLNYEKIGDDTKIKKLKKWVDDVYTIHNIKHFENEINFIKKIYVKM